MTRATYRHGKPPSRLARKIDQMLVGVAPARLFVMAWGLASIGLTAIALVAFGFFNSDSGNAPKPYKPVATKVALAAPSAATVESADNPDADPGALAFLKAKDPGSADMKHFRDVQWSGDFLRVYTDLNEEDTDSPAALKFCQWTVEYLEQNFKDQKPVVFVHAKKSDNGYVVLVNNAGAKKCRSVETR